MTIQDYQDARLRKDKNFDGKFFFGVKTTGIFCRPSCPSPTAREENVEYFQSVFEALDGGFRPCLRCRPDLSLEYYHGNAHSGSIVKKALGMIYDGYLNYNSLNDLAGELNLSDRHLRTLFVENLGMAPVKVAQFHKALFAKKLLACSNQTITDVAFASGFGSLRQFNEVFKETFGKTPTQVRKEPGQTDGDESSMGFMLPYTEPFYFEQILSFMGPRAMEGVEIVKDNFYARTFRTGHARGYFTVSDCPEQSSLKLQIYSDDIRCYMAIHNKVRRMFDLDTQFSAINEKFSQDETLSKGMPNRHVPQLPMAFDPFELVVRAILGQQITVKAATTLAARVAQKASISCELGQDSGLAYYFPNPKELIKLDLDGLGITKTRQATIKRVVQCILDNQLDLNPYQSFEEWRDQFSAIKGIGDWTVNYVAMRGLGMKDSFPVSDLGIINALKKSGKRLTRKEILSMAEDWRPYRAYAALCLWNYDQAR